MITYECGLSAEAVGVEPAREGAERRHSRDLGASGVPSDDSVIPGPTGGIPQRLPHGKFGVVERAVEVLRRLRAEATSDDERERLDRALAALR